MRENQHTYAKRAFMIQISGCFLERGVCARSFFRLSCSKGISACTHTTCTVINLPSVWLGKAIKSPPHTQTSQTHTEQKLPKVLIKVKAKAPPPPNRLALFFPLPRPLFVLLLDFPLSLLQKTSYPTLYLSPPPSLFNVRILPPSIRFQEEIIKPPQEGGRPTSDLYLRPAAGEDREADGGGGGNGERELMRMRWRRLGPIRERVVVVVGSQKASMVPHVEILYTSADGKGEKISNCRGQACFPLNSNIHLYFTYISYSLPPLCGIH